jgi:hypothetical protein
MGCHTITFAVCKPSRRVYVADFKYAAIALIIPKDS